MRSESDHGPLRACRSPFDGEELGWVRKSTREDVAAAVGLAAAALTEIAPAHRRAQHLQAVAARIDAERASLADLISREGGRPLRLAKVEVGRAIETYRHAAAEALTLTGSTIPMDATPAGMGMIAFTRPQPAGIVAAITPFNFPLNLVAHKVAPAIAAGCPVIVKPAEQTPLTALRLLELHEAVGGLPAGYLAVLPGLGSTVGGALVEDSRVRVVSFTGSTTVGWRLRAQAPKKKVLLELGGSAPAIVAADADLPRAAEELVQGAFASAGQSCISVQRIIVEESRFEDLTRLLVAAMGRLRVGDPGDIRSDVGPVIDAPAKKRIEAWIGEALASGAQLVTGGGSDGLVLSPCLLCDVPLDCRLWTEEVFGPVAVIRPYLDLAEAVTLANSTRFGLQAAVYTQSLATARQILDELEFGAVLINQTPTFRADQMPYGGIKDSGNTREGPAHAVRELIEEQLVVWGTEGSPVANAATAGLIDG